MRMDFVCSPIRPQSLASRLAALEIEKRFLFLSLSLFADFRNTQFGALNERVSVCLESKCVTFD